MKIGVYAAQSIHVQSKPDFSTRTYVNYIRAAARALNEQYGTDPGMVIEDIKRTLPYANPRRSVGLAKIETSLRRAWTCEQMIYNTHDPAKPLAERAPVISWLATHVYYAVHGALDAMLIAMGTSTTTHMKALNAYGATVRSKMPAWVLAVGCEGAPGTWKYHGFPLVPQACSVTQVAQNKSEYCNHLAVALRKTREEDAQATIDDWKIGKKRKTIPKVQRDRILSNRDVTTILHLFWRLRRRSNYGDIDLFIPDGKRDNELTTYVEAYLQILKFTVASFEAMIERRIGPLEIEKMIRRSPWALADCSDFVSARWRLKPMSP